MRIPQSRLEAFSAAPNPLPPPVEPQLSLAEEVVLLSLYAPRRLIRHVVRIATDKVLAAYPKRGVTRLAVAAPGFSADCVETVEELGIRGRETFLSAGGEKFARLDCLNDSPEGMSMLEALIARELAGWLPHP